MSEPAKDELLVEAVNALIEQLKKSEADGTKLPDKLDLMVKQYRCGNEHLAESALEQVVGTVYARRRMCGVGYLLLAYGGQTMQRSALREVLRWYLRLLARNTQAEDQLVAAPVS